MRGEMSTDAWDEQLWEGGPAAEAGAPRRTTAVVRTTWSGPVTATSEQRWLMTYDADGSARFVGLEHLAGSWDGRDGSCVLEHVGSFDGDGLASTWRVIPGSGTGDWSGLSGTGSLRNADGGAVTRWDGDLTLPTS